MHAVAPLPGKFSASKGTAGFDFTQELVNSSIGEISGTFQSLSPLDITQPSRADFFDHHFVTHFIESFGGLKETVPATPSTWLDELPVLVASPIASSVKHSIRAGAMLLYGTRVRDVSIQAEARRWYASALRGLRSGLSPNGRTKNHSMSFNEGTICAVVMLSHFETVAGTSLGAWFQHVDGASTMLSTYGPGGCRAGFTHDIFRHLRLLTVRTRVLPHISLCYVCTDSNSNISVLHQLLAANLTFLAPRSGKPFRLKPVQRIYSTFLLTSSSPYRDV